jgi:hypothetical protein
MLFRFIEPIDEWEFINQKINLILISYYWGKRDA